MSSGFAIHDLYARRLARRSDERGEIWSLVRFEDHLLRRFGLLEFIHAVPGAPPELRARPVADEIWFLIEGSVEFVWLDLRTGSPSEGRRERMSCNEPTLVLVPFGVAFGYRVTSDRATLVRLATHEQTETEEIRRLPWEDG